MPVLELYLLCLLGLGLALAAWSLLGGRRRGVLITTLIFLSGSALLAAAHRAEMLIYLGLAAGGFITAVLWEGPRGIPEER